MAIPPLLKDLNERAVLETIRSAAPISRAEISRRIGVSKPTVSLALRSLLAGGLVREAGEDARHPTYGAVYFEPVPEAAVVLGIDLGARFLRGAICDLAGRTRARRDVELDDPDAASVVASIVGLRGSLVESTGLPDRIIDGMVVGVPGVVEPDGETVALAANVPEIEGASFVRELRELVSGSVTSRTTSTSQHSASAGAGSRAASTTSRSCLSGRASARDRPSRRASPGTSGRCR